MNVLNRIFSKLKICYVEDTLKHVEYINEQIKKIDEDLSYLRHAVQFSAMAVNESGDDMGRHYFSASPSIFRKSLKKGLLEEKENLKRKRAELLNERIDNNE